MPRFKVTLPDSRRGMPRLPQSYWGAGMRVRFRRLRGITAKGVFTRPLWLPCVLGDFTVDEQFTHNDYETVNAGEFSSPARGRSLRTTDLETLTIDWHAYARWLTNPHVAPGRVRRELQKAGRAKTPFEILCVTKGPNGREELRMKATIRSLPRTLKPGEADTRYYTIEIKEWRDNTVGRRTTGGDPKLPITHELTERDTLASLARRYYAPPPGIPEGARLIKNANGMARMNWGLNTPLVKSKRWKVGDKIKIPAPIDTWNRVESRNLSAYADAIAQEQRTRNAQEG